MAVIKVKPGKPRRETKKARYFRLQREAKKTYGDQPFVNEEGYPCIYIELRGHVPLHRLVAEKALGRRLKRWEEVHHIDGDKMNASPRNLLICSTEYHKALHQRCKRRYGTWHLPSHYRKRNGTQKAS